MGITARTENEIAMQNVFAWFKGLVLAVWYFVSGLAKQSYIAILTVFGRVRVSWYFPFFCYDPKGYVITSRHIRKALNLLKAGDVLCRYYNGYIDGWFIPGRFSHTGVFVGEDEGFATIIHALGSGVQKIDVIDFLRCDGFAILRPKDKELQEKETVAEKACRIAKSYLGYTYDFFFDVCDDYANEAEVQKRTKSVYCHELTRSCYPDLDVPTVMPTLWGGMIRSSKRQFLAQSFFDSDDFTLIYDSDYSELRCDQK